MKNVIKILLLSWICMANSCKKQIDSENCHYAIKFSNNSSKELYVRDAHYIPRYPFASELYYLSYTVQDPKTYKVESGEQDNRKATMFKNCIEKRFYKDDYFSNTLYVYVFDAAVVENTPWDVVARDSLVLKRYDLTLENLQWLDWTITYPPDERMKDIKQYPPYEE